MSKTQLHASFDLQVELEIMLPEDMSVKESHDIALMLQHKVRSRSYMYASLAPGAPFPVHALAFSEQFPLLARHMHQYTSAAVALIRCRPTEAACSGLVLLHWQLAICFQPVILTVVCQVIDIVMPSTVQ